MISEELRKYIDMVNEEWANDQLFEMANLFSNIHGIENVVIWVGRTNKQHGLRIKVSKLPNKIDMDNTFNIMMPSLDYDPKLVPNWIKPSTMRKILDWIKLNQKLLYDYETGSVQDTVYFLNNISKV